MIAGSYVSTCSLCTVVTRAQFIFEKNASFSMNSDWTIYEKTVDHWNENIVIITTGGNRCPSLSHYSDGTWVFGSLNYSKISCNVEGVSMPWLFHELHVWYEDMVTAVISAHSILKLSDFLCGVFIAKQPNIYLHLYIITPDYVW